MGAQEQTHQLKIGGQWVTLKPLTPEAGVRLCLLLGPYIPKFRRVVKILEKGLDEDIAVFRLRQIAETLKDAPGEVIKMAGLLLDRDPAWVATHVSAAELVNVMPAVLEYHGIVAILALGEIMGLLDLGEELSGRN